MTETRWPLTEDEVQAIEKLIARYISGELLPLSQQTFISTLRGLGVAIPYKVNMRKKRGTPNRDNSKLATKVPRLNYDDIAKYRS
jgi:hypothetical protein